VWRENISLKKKEAKKGKMPRLIKGKVSGAVSYADLFGAGIVKAIEERALSPVVGNATLVSGGVKLAIGLIARKFLGRGVFGDSISLGFGIDGVEDIITAVITGRMSGMEVGGGENW